MPHPGGRPTQLTPQVLEDVRRLLPTCLYLETVADYIGVTRATIGNWLRRGAREARRLARTQRARLRKREAIFVEFFYVYKRALAEGAIFDLGVIKKAAQDQTDAEGKLIRPGQWQAAAWRAERRFPEQWGRKDTVVTSDVTQRELDAAIERELERLADARQAETAGAPAPENGGDPPVAAPPGPADDRLPDAG
jgi:hypothetical protein